jgi:hypothetical protein
VTLCKMPLIILLDQVVTTTHNHYRLIDRAYFFKCAFQFESGSGFWNDCEFAQPKPH